MGQPWQPYVVKQGDHLAKIAFLRGVDPQAIWSDPKNEALARRRKTGAMLHPGDILFVPPEPTPGIGLTKETANRYTAKVPTVAVAVRLVIDHKRMGASRTTPFTVTGAGKKPIDGETEPDGTARFEVPVLVREVVVHFPKLGIDMPVHVGHLDPIEERSGQKQRLQNLGYLRAGSEISDAELAGAFARLQRDNGKPVTGHADADTLNALRAAHLS